MSYNVGILIAGGVGSRARSALPKQYSLAGGVPIAIRSCDALLESKSLNSVVIVCQENYESLFKEWLSNRVQGSKAKFARNGETGQLSIFSGLVRSLEDHRVSDESIVVILDAVRPFVRSEHVDEAVSHAIRFGAAVCSSPANETIVYDDRNRTVLDRDKIKYARAPQAFNLKQLYTAHLMEMDAGRFGNIDSLSLMSSYGHGAFFFDGPPHNIKITTVADLKFAEGYFCDR